MGRPLIIPIDVQPSFKQAFVVTFVSAFSPVVTNYAVVPAEMVMPANKQRELFIRRKIQRMETRFEALPVLDFLAVASLKAETIQCQDFIRKWLGFNLLDAATDAKLFEDSQSSEPVRNGISSILASVRTAVRPKAVAEVGTSVTISPSNAAVGTTKASDAFISALIDRAQSVQVGQTVAAGLTGASVAEIGLAERVRLALEKLRKINMKVLNRTTGEDRVGPLKQGIKKRKRPRKPYNLMPLVKQLRVYVEATKSEAQLLYKELEKVSDMLSDLKEAFKLAEEKASQLPVFCSTGKSSDRSISAECVRNCVQVLATQLSNGLMNDLRKIAPNVMNAVTMYEEDRTSKS